MVTLLVFHASDPGSILMERNIFSSSILFFPIFFCIFCNKSLVAFYIEFIALANSSQQPLFYINFQIQNALSQLWLQICGYVRYINQQSV